MLSNSSVTRNATSELNIITFLSRLQPLYHCLPDFSRRNSTARGRQLVRKLLLGLSYVICTWRCAHFSFLQLVVGQLVPSIKIFSECSQLGLSYSM